MPKCKFCGYDDWDACEVKDLTDEELKVADQFGLTPEEFLHHRMGVCSDQLADEDHKTLPYNPKQFPPIWPPYKDYPEGWSGTLVDSTGNVFPREKVSWFTKLKQLVRG